MKETQLSFLTEYEINPYTMAILPKEYGSKLYSEILEVEDQYLSPFKPLTLIKTSCQFFGSSFNGRREGTKYLIGVTHKAPIIIDSHTSIFALPTTSPINPECIWLFSNHVEKISKHNQFSTTVHFRNGQNLIVPISHSSLFNQLSRVSMLHVKFTQHLEYLENKYCTSSMYLSVKRTPRDKRNDENGDFT